MNNNYCPTWSNRSGETLVQRIGTHTLTMNRKAVDLSNVCRLCLQSSQELTFIFDDQVPHQPEELSLSQKITACVSVEISSTDRGPHKICAQCVNNINTWHQFKEYCKAVDAYLQKYLNEVAEQNVPLPKVDDITNNVSENSLLGEFSLSSFDSVFEKNPNLKANLSSIFDVYLSDETPSLYYEPDKITDTINTIVANICDTTTASTCNTTAADACNTTAADACNTSTADTSNTTAADTLPSKSINLNPHESCLDANSSPQRRRKGYECELCNNTFSRFTNLLHHDDTVHQNIFRKYSCPTCGRLFISPNRVKLHELSHREKSHKCTVCDKLFSSAKSLKVHSRLHSGKYKCSTCGFVSTSKVYLEEHLLKHVGNETVYVCKTCSMSFTCRSSLLRHENIHLRHGGKIYKCSVCNVVTRRRCELQDHMLVHNLNKNVTNEYKCHLCPKSYRSKKALRVHVIRHNEGLFECKVCEKKLYSKYELREHEETHSDVKKFTCFHCDKKFSFRSTLVKHLKDNFPRVRSDIDIAMFEIDDCDS